MDLKERTKPEVESKLQNMSPFVKIEYLENLLKQGITFDLKKFIHEKLAELYVSRGMFSQVAKNFSCLADISHTFKDKIQHHMKEAEFWIKAGRFDRADESFRKALACGNTFEKQEMKNALKNFYFRQAESYEKSQKSSNALVIYEKVLSFLQSDLSETEKKHIKNRLLMLYNKLGKIREYMALKSELE